MELRPPFLPAFGKQDVVLYAAGVGEYARHLVLGLRERIDRAFEVFHIDPEQPLDVPREAAAAVVALYKAVYRAVDREHLRLLRLGDLHRRVGKEHVGDVDVFGSVYETDGAQAVRARIGGIGIVPSVEGRGARRQLVTGIGPEPRGVHKALLRGRVLHVLSIEDYRVYLPQLVQLRQRVLHGPQRPLLTGLRVRLYGWQRQHLPFAGLYLVKVAAQVMLVQALHDDDYRRIPGIDAVTDGALEALVDALPYYLGLGIVRLHRVVYDDGPLEHVGDRAYHIEELRKPAQLFIRRGVRDKPVVERLVGVYVHLARAEAGDLPLGGDGVELAAGSGLPPFGRPLLGLQSRFGEELLVQGLRHYAAYGLGVVVHQHVGVGQVQEPAFRVQRVAIGYEGLYARLGLAVPRGHVNHEPRTFAVNHVLQCGEYPFVVLRDYERPLVLGVKHSLRVFLEVCQEFEP